MKNRFDLLVFDWDGTLVDSIEWIVKCIHHAARECAYELPSEQASKNVIGLRLDEALSRLFPDAAAVTRKQLIRAYQSAYRSRPMTRNDFFHGVYDLLQQLKREGYALAIATGKTRGGLRKALEATGTSALFTATRCADETASKPDPMMLFQLMEETGIGSGRTVMIGDSIHDLQMARHADIESIAVSCGANSAQDLKQQNPLLCLQTTAELLEFLV
jgi:phosphoglycolate phosphatase